MAKIDIRYGCGCKYSTNDVVEAVGHCDSTGHKMTITGTITPDTATFPVKTLKTNIVPKKPHKTAKPTHKSEPMDTLEELRRKLGRS